jgi:hypothetical protein
MPRRDVPRRDLLREALAAIQPFKQSVLVEIASQLEKDLLAASEAHRAGRLRSSELEGIASYVSTMARSLPSTFGRRFGFDAAQIQAMSEDWGDRTLFSSMIVPCYGNDWGHASLHMPAVVTRTSAGEEQVYVVDLILLRGEDRIDQIDLLSYPWLAHELGHNLMCRHDRRFIPAVSEHLDAIARKLRLAAIADRGRTRAGSEKSIQELIEFWHPGADHRNWSHELGADLIALWALGPAYLAVFQDLLEEPNQNPYLISAVHPPYAVRVCALLNGAGRLGFETDASGLAKLATSWRSSVWGAQRANRFLCLADTKLIEVVVQAALEFCGQLGVTRCTTDRLATLETAISDLDSQEFGTNLLLSAWLAYSRKGRQSYSHWERRVVESLASSVRQ